MTEPLRSGRVARGRRPGRHSAVPVRDQDATAFTEILSQLLRRVPGARAAALVDVEGETVDYAGSLPPFDVKVAAAQWRVVIDELRLQGALVRTTFLALRAARASYQVHVLPEGYALVLTFSRAAGFGGWRRAVAACSLDLAREACWSWEGMLPIQTWHPAVVSTDPKGRPLTLGVGAESCGVEVLGAVASDLGPRERGWRVRLDTGVEATVVREAGGTWYFDDANALPALAPSRPKKSR